MRSTFDTIPRHTIARVAGVAYLLIIGCGLFAEMFVRAGMIVPGDAAATTRNITEGAGLFRISLAADVVMLTCDVIVGVALWVLLRSVSQGVAMLALVLRVLHAAVYGVGLFGLLYVLHLVGGDAPPAGLTTSEVPGLVMLGLKGQQFGYLVGLIFFGLHCGVLGYLVKRSDEFPSLLGVLLMIAAAGYLIDCIAQFLVADYAAVQGIFQPIVLLPALVAELGMGLYLTIKGVRRVSGARG